jgi:hypothetical protein
VLTNAYRNRLDLILPRARLTGWLWGVELPSGLLACELDSVEIQWDCADISGVSRPLTHAPSRVDGLMLSFFRSRTSCPIQRFNCENEVVMTKTVLYVVFGVPIMSPSNREFLGAYSTRARAERFVDVQPPSVQENLAISEVPLDEAWCDGDWWVIPGEEGDAS